MMAIAPRKYCFALAFSFNFVRVVLTQNKFFPFQIVWFFIGAKRFTVD